MSVSELSLVTKSSEETVSLARRLGEEYNNTSLFLLSGEFGAGKTTFLKGLVAGIARGRNKEVTANELNGLMQQVKSPSYTLINEYHIGEHCVYHCDLYRFQSESDIDFFEFEDIISDTRHTLLIEWAEQLSVVEALTRNVQSMKISVRYRESENERRITITPLQRV